MRNVYWPFVLMMKELQEQLRLSYHRAINASPSKVPYTITPGKPAITSIPGVPVVSSHRISHILNQTGPSRHLRERRIECIGGEAHIRGHVTGAVERHRDIGVAQSLLHNLGMHPLGQNSACVLAEHVMHKFELGVEPSPFVVVAPVVDKRKRPVVPGLFENLQ